MYLTEYRPKSSDNKASILKEIRISIDEACRWQPRKQNTSTGNDNDDDLDISEIAQERGGIFNEWVVLF